MHYISIYLMSVFNTIYNMYKPNYVNRAAVLKIRDTVSSENRSQLLVSSYKLR